MAVPAIAEATQERYPTIYDPQELKFAVSNQIVNKTKPNHIMYIDEKYGNF